MMSSDFRGIVEPRYAKGGQVDPNDWVRNDRGEVIANPPAWSEAKPSILGQIYTSMQEDPFGTAKDVGSAALDVGKGFIQDLYEHPIDTAASFLLPARILGPLTFAQNLLDSSPLNAGEDALVKQRNDDAERKSLQFTIDQAHRKHYADGGPAIDPNMATGGMTAMDQSLSNLAQRHGYAHGGRASSFDVLDGACRRALGRR